MRKLILAAALALATAPAFAADLMPGTLLGTSEDAITAALTEMGWEVRKFASEDGKLEVYAVMGEQMVEIYVDQATGEVVKISNE